VINIGCDLLNLYCFDNNYGSSLINLTLYELGTSTTMKTVAYIKTVLKVITHFVYPNSCLICKSFCKNDTLGICTGCLSKLEPTMHGDWVNNVTNNTFIDHAYSGWFFNDVFQNVIHSFKYLDRPKFAFHFGRYLANEILKYSQFPPVDMLIPVPLHPVKKRDRGYNQADWIAQGVAKELNIPISFNSLKKIKYTPSQTTLNMEEREKNVASVFHCSQSFNDLHICIIDDVLTTGSTISAVAKACKEAGAKKITALTLCTPKIKRDKI